MPPAEFGFSVGFEYCVHATLSLSWPLCSAGTSAVLLQLSCSFAVSCRHLAIAQVDAVSGGHGNTAIYADKGAGNSLATHPYQAVARTGRHSYVCMYACDVC